MSESKLAFAMHVPPPLPADSVYTSCYCEENIYLLAQAFSLQAGLDDNWCWDVCVVFISNDGNTVALWNQKAREDVVVWDYHVVLVLLPRESTTRNKLPDGPEDEAGHEAWVYDFDTRLPVPSQWVDYMQGTFPYAFDARLASLVGPSFQSLFRVIPAAAYLDHFASDRSHMLDDALSPEPSYKKPPPAYAALCGRKAEQLGIFHNLMESYVSMSLSDPDKPALGQADALAEEARKVYGEVMDMTGFVRWISGENA